VFGPLLLAKLGKVHVDQIRFRTQLFKITYLLTFLLLLLKRFGQHKPGLHLVLHVRSIFLPLCPEAGSPAQTRATPQLLPLLLEPILLQFLLLNNWVPYELG